MPKRLILRGLVAAGVVTTLAWLALGDAEPALAFHPYHDASQYTSQADGHFYHGDQLPQPYYGWAGVNGQIVTPSEIPVLNSTLDDHAAGYIDVNFSTSPVTWFQLGWFTGSGGCPGGPYISRGIVSTYVEVSAPGYCYIEDLGAPDLGQPITYRIQRDSSSGCWNVYIFYSTLVDTFCGLNNTGAPQATSEVLDGTGGGTENPIEMEVSKWGWNNPNINKALRLMGAGGYEPWDTSLRAKYTARYDERLSDPTYYISYYNLFYYFLAYGELQ